MAVFISRSIPCTVVAYRHTKVGSDISKTHAKNGLGRQVQGRRRTSIMRHNARMALALYNTSLPTEVSFIIMLVDMMTSSAVFASSFKIKYTICRKDGSLFWNSFEMPKKSVVASLVGKVSPVNEEHTNLGKKGPASSRGYRGRIEQSCCESVRIHRGH